MGQEQIQQQQNANERMQDKTEENQARILQLLEFCNLLRKTVYNLFTNYINVKLGVAKEVDIASDGVTMGWVCYQRVTLSDFILLSQKVTSTYGEE